MNEKILNLDIPSVSWQQTIEKYNAKLCLNPVKVYCYMPIRCDIPHSTIEAVGFSAPEELNCHIKKKLEPFIGDSFELAVLTKDSSPLTYEESSFGCDAIAIKSIGNHVLDGPIKIGYVTTCWDTDLPESVTQFRYMKKEYCNYVGDREWSILLVGGHGGCQQPITTI